MAIFDAPTRDHCTVQRQQTNTPLQALALLNESLFVEASRALAERVMTATPHISEQIALAYRRATGRVLDPQISQKLLELWRQEKSHFEQDPQAAEALLRVGEYPINQDLDSPHMAALTVVTNLILNLDETVTKR